MRVLPVFTLLACATQHINGASLPESENALNYLGEQARSAPQLADIVSPDHTLERRKGGGGRGGGGGSSGGSSGGGGGGRTSSSSSAGGSTRAGSGPPRAYGGGYYGGGASTPYSAGSKTPKGLLAGALIAPAAILLIMPGIWLYSVYPYHYNNPYRFYNRTAVNETNNNNLGRRQNTGGQGQNQSLPVLCLCQDSFPCGCDENDDQKYLDDLVGNGSYAALNKTLVTVSDVNNTRTLVLNGTLPRGTTAPGGTDDAAVALALGKYAGYWAVGLAVLYGVML